MQNAVGFCPHLIGAIRLSVDLMSWIQENMVVKRYILTMKLATNFVESTKAIYSLSCQILSLFRAKGSGLGMADGSV